MVSKELKAQILANIILQKGKDINKVEIPEECKMDVYIHVGYARIMEGNIYEGINILRKAKEFGYVDFVDNVAKIAFQKIRDKKILDGCKIIRVLEALGYNTDYSKYVSVDDLIDIARMILKDNRLEEGFSLLNLIIRMDDNKSFIPVISEIGYEKISSGDTDMGIKILEKIKDLVGDEALTFLGDYIFNKLKVGEIEFGMELLEKIIPLVGTKYFDHALEIGYQKLAKGEVDTGLQIVEGIKKLGGKVDDTILKAVKG
jgi:hypothetical protein